eukprot:761074-Hanusia_phi.AAC.6
MEALPQRQKFRNRNSANTQNTSLFSSPSSSITMSTSASSSSMPSTHSSSTKPLDEDSPCKVPNNDNNNPSYSNIQHVGDLCSEFDHLCHRHYSGPIEIRTSRSSRQNAQDDMTQSESERQDFYSRCTHFVSIPVDNVTILQRVTTVQDSIVQKQPTLLPGSADHDCDVEEMGAAAKRLFAHSPLLTLSGRQEDTIVKDGEWKHAAMYQKLTCDPSLFTAASKQPGAIPVNSVQGERWDAPNQESRTAITSNDDKASTSETRKAKRRGRLQQNYMPPS